MQTITCNGSTPTIEHTDRRADLDAWEDAISDLDAALADAARIRASIDTLTLCLERAEAMAVLRTEGPNAEARRARLTLELADDAQYSRTLAERSQCRLDLAHAERHATIARERCRLLRAALRACLK